MQRKTVSRLSLGAIVFFRPDPFPVDDAFRELYIWNRKHSDDLRCPRNCVANDWAMIAVIERKQRKEEG